MDKPNSSNIVKIVYYIAPQDRRKVEGQQMYEYILRYFQTIFGDKLTVDYDATKVNAVNMATTGVPVESVNACRNELDKIIDLCSKSYCHIEELNDRVTRVDDNSGGCENEEKNHVKERDEEYKETYDENDDADQDAEYDEDNSDEDNYDEDEYEDDDYDDDGYDEEDYDEDVEENQNIFSEYLTGNDDKASEETDDIETIMKDIEDLVGAEEFKKLCRNIVRTSQSSKAKYLKDYFSNCALCFSINGGDGLSTYIMYLAKLLTATGIMKIDSAAHAVEVRKAESFENMEDIFRSYAAQDEIVSIDLTYKIDKCGSDEFRSFLRELFNNNKDRLPLFKLPYYEGARKEKVIDEIASVFPLITVDITPPSTSDYAKFAKKFLKGLGYDVEPEALNELEQLIIQTRNKEHFYGFRSIKQLVGDIIYRKNLIEVKENTDMSLVITEKDLLSMLTGYDVSAGGIEELDEMIGMQEIKNRIEEIVVQLEIAKGLPDSEKPSMHMMFTGAPGTGKTTVARILGKILKNKGLLSKGFFFERTGRDLCGRYIGETAPITNSICRDAYGSILFIDEAYTLAKQADDDKDFGKEALETLLTHMENHRNDFVVIFAGYSEEMKKLLNMNPGLASRMPHEIKFRNYSRDELYQIYMKLAQKRFPLADDLEVTVKRYFENLSDEVLASENFANARFVRNLYERTISKAALRYQAQTGGRIEADTKITLTSDDFVNASLSDEFNSLQKKNDRVIGFM